MPYPSWLLGRESYGNPHLDARIDNGNDRMKRVVVSLNGMTVALRQGFEDLEMADGVFDDDSGSRELLIEYLLFLG